MPARVDPLSPEALTAAQRELYDRLLSGPRARGPRPSRLTDEEGRLRGPFDAMLYNPDLGDPLQELGAAVRYRTGFSDREREIAILTVAAHERSDFEWKAHSRIGRDAGLTDDELARLRDGAPCAFEDPAENAVLAAARELVGTET